MAVAALEIAMPKRDHLKIDYAKVCQTTKVSAQSLFTTKNDHFVMRSFLFPRQLTFIFLLVHI